MAENDHRVNESFQGIIPADTLLTSQKFRVLSRCKPTFKWNHMYCKSNKELKMLVTKKVIKMDQDAVENIQKQIFKEHQDELVGKKKNRERHDMIR